MDLLPSSAVRRSRRTYLAAALVAAVLGGCGGDDAPTSAPDDCDRIEGGTVTLVAENLAWSTDCLRVEAGTTVTFTVDNRDRGVGHNLSVFGPSGREKTGIEVGPAEQTLVYEAGVEGHHQFVCDPHPNMEGQLWVDPA